MNISLHELEGIQRESEAHYGCKQVSRASTGSTCL